MEDLRLDTNAFTEDERLHIKKNITANRFYSKVSKGDAVLGSRRRGNTVNADSIARDQLSELKLPVNSPRRNDLKHFLDYVMRDCCACVEKECVITGMKTTAPTLFQNYIENKTHNVNISKSCSVIGDTIIQTKEFQDLDEPMIIDKIIELFEAFGLLSYNATLSRYYLLNGNKRLSWKNIKQLDRKYILPFINAFPSSYVEIYKTFNNIHPEQWEVEKFVVYVKYLFWYFRKAIVDTITRYIVRDTQVTAISVGSTNVDSDYDITLYGNNHNVFKTINAFNTKVMSLFNTEPDIVFDTNMYGVSFIKSGEEYQCGSNKFALVKTKSVSEESVVLQNVWGVIKVVSKLNEVQKTDEGLYELLFNTLQSSNNSNFLTMLQIAEMFVNKYEPSHDLYDKIVRAMETIDADSEEYLNYISFVNYNGLETYFTMGAFINVVVNGQMCRDQPQQTVPLTVHEYYDSAIENIADLMVHYNKEKYLLRAKQSVRKIMETINNSGIQNALDLLENIGTLQLQCKRVDTLINCSKFLLMNTCMQCIKQISEIYFMEMSDVLLDRGLEKFELYVAKFPTRKALEGMRATGSLEDLIMRLSPVKNTPANLG